MPDILDMPAGCRIDADLGVAKVQIGGGADTPQRLAATLGLGAPAPNRYSENGSIALSAIAPGEWLLTGPADAVATALGYVDETFREDVVLALDLTHGRTALRFEGPAGQACLAALTPLDLRPDRFPVGAAVRTRLGDIGAFVARTGDAPAFLLIVDQSYTAYVLHLIGHAANAA